MILYLDFFTLTMKTYSTGLMLPWTEDWQLKICQSHKSEYDVTSHMLNYQSSHEVFIPILALKQSLTVTPTAKETSRFPAKKQPPKSYIIPKF